MNNDYLDSLIKLSRKRQLKLTKDQEHEIFKVYEKACMSYYEKFVDNMDKDTATRALLYEYTQTISNELSNIIQEYNIKGAQNSLSIIEDIMSSSYEGMGLKDTPYAKAVHEITRAGISRSAKRIIEGGIYKDGNGLSKRIWKSVNASGEKINEVIASCMAQQLSAVEMSKVLKTFMHPGQTKEWDKAKIKELLGPGYASWNKNINYEALRLARTTINHSATLGMKEGSKVNPYLHKAKWHSVHAVGRTCSQCKERDGRIYTLAQLPFDHPNGLCYNEPILDKSLEEIGDELKKWVNGEPNAKLDNYWKKHGPSNIPVPSKLDKPSKQNIGKNKDNEYDKMFSNLREQMGDDYWQDIRSIIQDSPQFMQDWYKANQHIFNYDGADDDGGAFYDPTNKYVVMDFFQAKHDTRGKYSTFFHEFGHQLDNEASNTPHTISGSMRFLRCLEQDFNNKLIEFGKGINSQILVERDVISELRHIGDISSGVQDLIGGLSKGDIMVSWGHSEQYWDQGYESLITQEAFAHMCSAYTNPERLKVMEDWFPSSCEMFKDMILKNISK